MDLLRMLPWENALTCVAVTSLALFPARAAAVGVPAGAATFCAGHGDARPQARFLLSASGDQWLWATDQLDNAVEAFDLAEPGYQLRSDDHRRHQRPRVQAAKCCRACGNRHLRERLRGAHAGASRRDGVDARCDASATGSWRCNSGRRIAPISRTAVRASILLYLIFSQASLARSIGLVRAGGCASTALSSAAPDSC